MMFKDKMCAHIARAGGKGASLARLTQAGFPVPPGFVVGAGAFETFLRENELGADIEAVLKQVKHEDMNSVDRASHEIRAMISTASVAEELEKEVFKSYRKLKAKFVAVRSSATAEDSETASWAGELETYLNVQEKELIVSVKICWASLFTPRAIFYRHEKKLHEKPMSVAVVVQAMIESVVSGVCFTVHPVTKDRNHMVVEACWGLGEALVSGQITPDTYVMHKDDFMLIDATVSQQEFRLMRGMRGTIRKRLSAVQGRRQKLSPVQIKALTVLCKKIEHYYRHPQDIEWAYVKGKWHILQSRPITTL